MNKTEYIEAVAKRADVSKAIVSKVVAASQDVTIKTLKKGDSLQLTGWGTFSVAKRAARKGRNPSTGKEIKIAACKTPKFKAGKILKDSLR
mgnify:FL=1